MTATSTETENGDTAQTIGTFGVTVSAVADAPTLTVSDASGAGLPIAPGGTVGAEISLDINPTLVDTDGSETLSITISEVPAGATLSAGTDNGNGSWTLTQGQLAGLTVTPPPGTGADFTLTVTATATEAANGDTAQIIDTINVTVNAIHGTQGNDILVDDGTGIIYGEGGGDQISGLAGDDYLDGGAGEDRLFGGDGNDTLVGGSDGDLIYGGTGNDGLAGGSGNDVLYGEAGNDQIRGGSGNDAITGGAGNDVLRGGGGNDTFFVEGPGQGFDDYNGGSGTDVIKALADNTEIGLDSSFRAGRRYRSDQRKRLQQRQGRRRYHRR